MLLVVVIMALLALVLLLVPGQGLTASWTSLGMMAMFLQWIGLLSLMLLCLSSPMLKRVSLPLGSALTFALIQLVTFVVSELTFQVTQNYGVLGDMVSENHTLYLLRNLALSIIISGVALRYLYIQRQLRIRIETENQAKIQALQARIRPHFLFNSMNTIAALVHDDADAAEKVILDLSEIYRATLKADDALTTLADEVALTRAYLEVEKLRLNERLSVDWNIQEAALSVALPGLLIQPLVENAVYHGIEPRAAGGTVSIDIKQDKKLRISIKNPLPRSGDETQQRGNQIAIKNIRERLHITYGKQAMLQSSQDENEYRVYIEIPVAGS